MNDPAIAATPLMPSARPRWSLGKASVRIAAEFANSIAPPIPCTTSFVLAARYGACAPVRLASMIAINRSMLSG